MTQMPDLTSTGAVVSGKRAFEAAGVAPSDIDVVEVYDSFTITTLLTLEALGFAERGRGRHLVRDGAIGPGGVLPVNTSGGGLSYCHPGMFGIFVVIEAVRQLRGRSRSAAGSRMPSWPWCTGPAGSCRATPPPSSEGTADEHGHPRHRRRLGPVLGRGPRGPAGRPALHRLRFAPALPAVAVCLVPLGRTWSSSTSRAGASSTPTRWCTAARIRMSVHRPTSSH